MCIAVYKKKGVTIPIKTLKECYTRNPDGAGFMYVDNGKLEVTKGYFTFDEFWQAYKKHQTKQAVLHFRIKTHGPIDAENCHPFVINDKFAFVHNGVISGFGNDKFSDTLEFNSSIIKPMVAKWGIEAMFEEPVKELIEARIGYSKLIFLDNEGNYDIFNEDKGTWDNNVWFSNTSYKPKPALIPVNYKQQQLPYATAYPKPNPYFDKPKSVRTLKEGDEVILLSPVKEDFNDIVYPAGTILEVLEINQDNTANLMNFSTVTAEYLFSVPFYKFDFFDPMDEKDSLDLDPVSTNNRYWRY